MMNSFELFEDQWPLKELFTSIKHSKSLIKTVMGMWILMISVVFILQTNTQRLFQVKKLNNKFFKSS
jgi:hypothetical protein